MTFAGAVLAGGSSRRMGRDKAFITVDGVEMVISVVRALNDAGASSVTAIGGDEARLGALALDRVPDRFPGDGPLGGIITALEHTVTARSSADRVVTLACDLLSPSPQAVREIVAVLDDDSIDVAVPVVDGISQWLHTAWRTHALESLTAAFGRGIRAPRLALAGLRVAEIEAGDRTWFQDADRPEDLPSGNVE